MADLPRGCTVVEVDDSSYSSFVPIIGMYIAGISLVCFIALFYDIFSVFRHKKRWLPCQLFSLNSLTLTLLGIAAKLPVDLTSSMPTPLDQFSKLTGTSLICISMGFLMPSLGTTPKAETHSNMLALSIFVVTVVVNICIQIRTGVIFLLIVEHIMVICFMLAMLIVLWFCSVTIAGDKSVNLDRNIYEFRESEWPLLRRLEIAYLYAFNLNPQFLLCTNNQIYVVAGLCIACSVVTVQAAIRNLSLEFCGGSSDYGWPVWVIVVVQFLIVVVGSSATIFRCLGLFNRVKMSWSDKFITADARFDIVKGIEGSFFRMNSGDWCSILLKILALWIAGILYVLICIPLRNVFGFVSVAFHFVSKSQYEQDKEVGNYKNLTDTVSGDKLQDWGLSESVKDMRSWKTVAKGKSLENLAELLQRVEPSNRETQLSDWKIGNIEVSSLSVVVLVRIAQTLPSSNIGLSLLRSYDEVYEIVHFVEDKVKLMDIDSRKKSKLAEALRMGHDLRSCRDPTAETNGSNQLHVDSFEGVYKDIPVSLISEEAEEINEYIQNFQTSGYECIERLFVDMLLMFLTRLPHALFKEVTESTAEDFYDCVKTSLGILCRVKPLETQIPWSFPREFDEVCGLITSKFFLY